MHLNLIVIPFIPLFADPCFVLFTNADYPDVDVNQVNAVCLLIIDQNVKNAYKTETRGPWATSLTWATVPHNKEA